MTWESRFDCKVSGGEDHSGSKINSKKHAGKVLLDKVVSMTENYVHYDVHYGKYTLWCTLKNSE